MMMTRHEKGGIMGLKSERQKRDPDLVIKDPSTITINLGKGRREKRSKMDRINGPDGTMNEV